MASSDHALLCKSMLSLKFFLILHPVGNHDANNSELSIPRTGHGIGVDLPVNMINVGAKTQNTLACPYFLNINPLLPRFNIRAWTDYPKFHDRSLFIPGSS